MYTTNHEQQQKHPSVGSIYMLRQSVHSAFGLPPASSSTTSSSIGSSSIGSSSTGSSSAALSAALPSAALSPSLSSAALPPALPSAALSSALPSTTSNKKTSKKKHHPKKGPCLVWNVKPGETVILLLASFENHHPKNTDILVGLTREYLMIHLLSIDPTPPLNYLRTIKLITPTSIPSYLIQSSNNYLVLKPVSIRMEIVWPDPVPEYFSFNDMLYINEIMTDLYKQEQIEMLKKSQHQMMHNISGAAINNGMNNDNKNDDNDEESNASGSTYSSIPGGRVLIIDLFDRNNSAKHNRIQKWINQCSENELSNEELMDI